MTGTGTQLDPYIVSTWDEFTSKVSETGKYVEFPLQLRGTSDTTIQRGKLYYDAQGNLIANPVQSGLSGYYENGFEIDLNAVYPEGVPDAAVSGGVSCAFELQAKFDGRGGVIRNLYARDLDNLILVTSETDWSPELNNVDIFNIYYVGKGSYHSSAVIHTPPFFDAGLIRKTRISGVFYNSAFYLHSGVDVNFERCAIALRGNSTDQPFISGGISGSGVIFKNTLVNISGIFPGIVYGGFSIGMSNSKITGYWTLTGNSGISLSTFDASVIDGVTDVSVDVYCTDILVPSVINTQTMPNITYTPSKPSNLIEATTAQLGNASWLLDHGFPVGRLS